MSKLYRAISQAEKDDYDQQQRLLTGQNTLEGKQFFKSLTAVKQFVANSVLQDFDPPYVHLLTIRIDDDLFELANPEHMPLDGFEAVNVTEDNLDSFNNCIIFVKEEVL
jgi:hypothetical protein